MDAEEELHAVQALRQEVTRLRALVEEAFDEGLLTGIAYERIEFWGRWPESDARKALDGE